jgi:very-short-patch-repair endonuclease
MGGKPHRPPREDGRRYERERALAALATRQHGVIARYQLLAAGLTPREVERRLEAGRLHRLHRGVYAVGHECLSRQGRWLAAVLAHGDRALLSHASAAALWRLLRPREALVDVTAHTGRAGRPGIRLHRGRVHPQDRESRTRIPVTSVGRTLLDLAGERDGDSLARVFEEADRLGLLRIGEVRRVCGEARGHHGAGKLRRLVEQARRPTTTRSPLEDRFVHLCEEQRLPRPSLNCTLLGFEVDALWPRDRVVVELDGFAFHRHHAAFQRDRLRDARLQAAGYRVVRLTSLRIEGEAATVAEEIRALFSPAPRAGQASGSTGSAPAGGSAGSAPASGSAGSA